MKFSVWLVMLVTVCQASAQAPGDESSTCMYQRGPYHPNTRVLMDSRNYDQLITGSGAVWQALNVDGTGSGWRSSFGGLCTAQPRSCDFREGTPQNNWFFTQYIRYTDATEVFVNITANFQECRLASNPSCTQLYLDMYRYERNGVNAPAARSTTNYQLVRRIEQPSGFGQQQYNASFSFTPSGNTNGFYLGFRDTGTCLNILRLQVYYRISLQRTVGLVTYPEIALPRIGSGGSVTAVATCANNSTNITSLQVTCFADGQCVSVASCACVPGYEYMAGACRACSPGMYKAGLRNTQCQSCPANSTVVGVVTCNCTRRHYRMNGEGAADPCTTPPSAVRNVRVTEPVGNTTVEVHWDPPLSNGGRTDGFHYNIEYREVGNLGSWIRANEDRIRSNTYLIRGLKPVTRYIVRIIAGNNVSDQEPEIMGDRTTESVVKTTEGIPGPPQYVQVLENTVVLWQAPQVPNGNITGYEVRISTIFGQTIATRDITASGVLHYVIRENDVTDSNIRMARIEVRARTLAGSGNWSTSVTAELEPSTVVTCPPTTCPTTCPTCPPVVDAPTTPSETCPPCPTCQPPPVCTCPTTPTVTCPSCPPVVTCPTTPTVTCPSCPPVITCPTTPTVTCPTCQPPPVVTCPTTPTVTQPSTATTQLTTPPTTPPSTPTTLPPNTLETGTISNIWVVNMEAFWDPPSNSTGTIRSYVVRVQYDKNKGRFANLRRCRINDLAVRQWKLDSIPSQRPLYFQVRVTGSAGNGPWSKRVILVD